MTFLSALAFLLSVIFFDLLASVLISLLLWIGAAARHFVSLEPFFLPDLLQIAYQPLLLIAAAPLVAAGAVAGGARGTFPRRCRLTQTKHWALAWRFSLRASGWLLALIAGVLLIARVAIALANSELAEGTFASFEVIVPLIAGLHAALLFAPDDEPALELLLAAPRPPVYLIYERLGGADRLARRAGAGALADGSADRRARICST